MRAGVVDHRGAVLDTVRVSTPSDDDALEDTIALATKELAGRHPVAAVGLAVAGFVATDRHTVLFAPHLPWRRAPVVERVRRRLDVPLDVPVVLEHDANACAVAEYRFGAARGTAYAVLVAIGTGIGGALLIRGEVYRGAYGVAPELGHLPLVPGGRQCPCGKRGCWERYCSGTALAATAVELMARAPWQTTALLDDHPAGNRGDPGDPPQITGRRVAAAARAGDPLATRAMADLAHWLGEGLALVADVYDPELIVVGGGVAGSAPLFLDEAREHYANVVTGAGHRPLARIRAAQLGGDEAGIVGAATLARDLVTPPAG